MADQRVLVNRVNSAMRTGDLADARRALLPLARMRPDDPQVLLRLGICETQLGMWDDARTHLERAAKIGPDAVVYCKLASLAELEGRVEDARAAIASAKKLAPNDPAVIYAEADLLLLSGRAREAYDLIIAARNRGVDAPILTALLGRACRRLRHFDEAIALLQPSADDPSVPPGARRLMLFRLGEIHDAMGMYDRAWECYQRANALAAVRFDADRFARDIDDLLRAWTRDAAARLPRARGRADRHVFIVGMPRCGSSLVEQIADAHPRIFGVGELPFLNQAVDVLGASRPTGFAFAHNVRRISRTRVDRAAAHYVRQASRLNATADRFIDKALFNFAHLGVIDLLLPGARIIHCTRDPLDTCLSVFFQDFGTTMSFAFDLDHIAAFYSGYRRIMEHWRSMLDLDVLDVAYEEMVAQQEAQSRRIIEYLGLEWDDACLRFHQSDRITVTASNDQVRQPIYRSSVRRWEHYANHLGTLRAALGPNSAV